MNVIFTGEFSYPKGMAGTQIVQHAIDGLKGNPDVLVHVVVLRQSSKLNMLSGTHLGTSYETVMGDLYRSKALLLAPWLYLKGKQTIRRLFQPDQKNVLFVYGPPSWANTPIIRFARRCGYKVVYYIVEDYDYVMELSKSFWHKVRYLDIQNAAKAISSLADGIIVISSHLKKKYLDITHGSVPLLYRPISIDIERYVKNPRKLDDRVTLYYSGTFGSKDGVPVLLDAFDRLASAHANIFLTLVGKGTAQEMIDIFQRIDSSPFKDRIDYKGPRYGAAYYSTLESADIPCMTRVNTRFANAGFPFKLGEFLASGKPVIASRVSDVESMLEDRHEAMLVKPGESREIVEAVEYLIANPIEASTIGRRGQQKARELFDYRVQAPSLLSFLQNL